MVAVRQFTRGVAAMTRLIVATLLAALALSSGSAADPKPKDVILGKWESLDDLSKGVVVEFKKDDTTVATFMDRQLTTGKYKFVEDDVMEVASNWAAKPLVMKFRVTIKDDVLTQKDAKTGIEKKMK